MPDHGALEAERDFLLRSLDDLELERQAGNVDDDTYQVLHDDYTARAASVIRALRDDVDPPVDERPPGKRWMRVATFTGIVVFAAAAALLLANTVGSRNDGQTVTGNDANAAQTIEDLAAAAEANPDSYPAQIAYARAALSTDPSTAIAQFAAAGRIDPSQPEPPTYIGWISKLTADQLSPGADRDALTERAVSELDRAIELDPTYEDAYVFRALTKRDLLGDAAGAASDFQLFLVNAPDDHPMRPIVLDALAELSPATTSVTPSSSP
jgi:tetratricopeptide (TPR) repeat protein